MSKELFMDALTDNFMQSKETYDYLVMHKYITCMVDGRLYLTKRGFTVDRRPYPRGVYLAKSEITGVKSDSHSN